jgi:lipopolysaccharide/colanic/teichoic acid biosynthesis glycosyltransferase
MHLYVKQMESSSSRLEEVCELQEQCAGPKHAFYTCAKVPLDWLAALVLAPMAATVVLLCAAMVKFTSPGPVFYRQRRVGLNGKLYWIYKLRTMQHNCESRSGPQWSTPNDPRVTRFGRFLRDTHLDELPQIINVLRGEMSLIGPRPERPELMGDLEREIPYYRDRLLVRPGLTGLAQMQLPPDSNITSVRRKLAYDRYYVQQMNLSLDVRIALCTVLYMCGALSHAMGKLLVKSHANEVEREWLDLDLAEQASV